jgi:GTP-binding protein YchF
MDALAMTVRVFERDSVPHPESRVDPVADLDTLLTEFNLADLAIAEKRCQRLTEQLKKGTQEERDKVAHEKQIIERVIATLSAGQPLRTLELTPEEQTPIRGFGFLSQKPLLVLANVGDFTSDIEQKRLAELEKYCQDAGLRMLAINGDLECELREIDDPEEQKEYLDAMGIERRAASAVIQAAYQITHSETFLTAGEPEVRAWTIPVGSKAVEAAGKIHSDIARGFIRAEVVPYEHLIHDGSIAKAREAGHYREEGKEAIIKDGDVIYFRFNV